MIEHEIQPIADELRRRMSVRQEAEKVYANLNADHEKIAHYVVERCGDFMYDKERENFIAEFLKAAGHASAGVATDCEADRAG